MLSSLAVIQPENERFGRVCCSSRAPFAEGGPEMRAARRCYLRYLKMELPGAALPGAPTRGPASRHLSS